MVVGGPPLSLFEQPIKLTELDEADCTLHVGHPIVEAEQIEVWEEVGLWPCVALLLGDRCAVVAQHVRSLRECIVVSGDHAALARGDRFPRMKREDRGTAERPRGASPV